MEVLIPTNLDCARDIRGYEAKYHEKYLWVIHLILLRNLITKNSFRGYVNLNSSILQYFIGDKFACRIVQQLKDSGIIEINSSYLTGKYSRSYRLTPAFSSSGFIRIPFKGKKAGVYFRKQKERSKQKLSESSIDKEVLKQMDHNVRQVQIDTVKALKNLEDLYQSGVIGSIHAKSCCDFYINSISTGDVFFTHSDNTGRIYHSIGNCSRTVRPFFSFNGKRLFHIDIANSQPLFFCLLLDEYMRSQFPGLANPSDVSLYFELTAQGKFYEYLMDQFGIPESERGKFKTDFFTQIFYSEVRSNWEYKNAREFKKLFPTVYAAVLWYKRHNHADLPIRLQQMESSIIINRVCYRVVKENAPADRPYFLTVHDSIVCLEKDQEYIHRIFMDELTGALGFAPTLRKKLFHQ